MVDSREERTECGVFERVMERALGQHFWLEASYSRIAMLRTQIRSAQNRWSDLQVDVIQACLLET